MCREKEAVERPPAGRPHRGNIRPRHSSAIGSESADREMLCASCAVYDESGDLFISSEEKEEIFALFFFLLLLFRRALPFRKGK